MSVVKKPIATFNASVENISRHKMLNWVNETVNGKYKKIEELRSGVAYCQIMKLLFPNSICIQRVKVNAKLEYEFSYNLKLFQMAFVRAKIDKSVPIEQLLKGRFQDNFEFLQWFKKLYDSVSSGRKDLIHGQKSSKKTVNSNNSNGSKPVAEENENLNINKNHRALSPKSYLTLKETCDKLQNQIKFVEGERNFIYKKLIEIENLLKQSIERNERNEWCQRLLNLLYNIDDENSNSQKTQKIIVPTNM